MGIFTGLFRSRDKPKNYYHSPSYAYWFGQSKSGAEVNPFTAMQQSAVYACIKVLAESVAQLPLHLYERTEHGKEPAVQHPLYKVLHDQPNPEMTSYTFREVLMTHLLIYGNAYAQIIRNGRGEVLGLYPLAANRVRVEREDSGELVYLYRRYDDANPISGNRARSGCMTLTCCISPAWGSTGWWAIHPSLWHGTPSVWLWTATSTAPASLPTGQHPAAC